MAGLLLRSCLEAGAVVSPLMLQHVLLSATQEGAWRAAKEVLQVSLVACWGDARRASLCNSVPAARRGTSGLGHEPYTNTVISVRHPPSWQVTCAANHLDAVAQLLQTTRTNMPASPLGGDAAAMPPGWGLCVDAIDELLFLTYLQAQFVSGNWSDGLKLFKQLQQV
jgi:hypothetical protein